MCLSESNVFDPVRYIHLTLLKSVVAYNIPDMTLRNSIVRDIVEIRESNYEPGFIPTTRTSVKAVYNLHHSKYANARYRI